MIEGKTRDSAGSQSNVVHLNSDPSNILYSRYLLAARNGMQFSGARNLNEVLGYKQVLTIDDFYDYYKRDGFARRIINAYPDATWRANPRIMEDEDKDSETKFERSVNELATKFGLWNYCKRFDRLSGIGRYGVMVMGYSDGKPLDQPLLPGSQLIWLRPISEKLANIDRLVSDASSNRFGMPETYNITLGGNSGATTGETITRKVHHSRVVHFAWDLMEDDVYGMPFLEAVFDRLFDLQKVVGGSSEMYWLGARSGMQFVAENGNQIVDPTKLKQEAEEFMHQLRRFMTVKGGKWETMQSSFHDPKGTFDMLIACLSAMTGIPARILTGSERGELASSQDETNFNNVIKERRLNTAGPLIIKPVIDHLIMNQAIVAPQNPDYFVDWDSIDDMSPTAKADINAKKAESLSKYASNPYAEGVVPKEEFRERFLDLPPTPAGGFPEDVDDDLPEEEDASFGDAVTEEDEELDDTREV